MKRILGLVLLSLSLLLPGCSGDSPTDGDGVSFSAEVQPIFDANCGACHPPAGGLDLSPAGSYANLVSVVSTEYGVMRVQPGDPYNSVLYGKASGESFPGAMPPVNLSAMEIETILLWIQEGALDN